MAENSAPFDTAGWSIRYYPENADCAYLVKKNGDILKFSSDVINSHPELIVKCNETKYLIETWVFTNIPCVRLSALDGV